MVDGALLSRWIGKRAEAEDSLDPGHAVGLAMSLDRAPPAPGAALPLCWHWIYFTEKVPQSRLGSDGHAQRGDFLPPVPLERRMWAGGRLAFTADLRLGVPAQRRSEIADVRVKDGRAGPLVIVVVRHEIDQDGRTVLREEHDIVYVGGRFSRRRPDTAEGLPPPVLSRTVTPDPAMLFRYSALTFNAHRIHYDRAFCREHEGYPDLVVHGPLTATLLAGLAADCVGHRRIENFSYRALAPAFVGEPMTLRAAETDTGLTVWSAVADRRTMVATVSAVG